MHPSFGFCDDQVAHWCPRPATVETKKRTNLGSCMLHVLVAFGDEIGQDRHDRIRHFYITRRFCFARYHRPGIRPFVSGK